jgi:DNA-binding MarR family transcriptional regulator
MPSTPTTVDALAQLSFTVQLTLTRIAAENALSVTQLRLLGILRDRAPSMAAIAEHLDLDRSSVSGLIDRAERRGLVERVRSDTDARVIQVRATPDGLALAESVGAEVGVRLERMLASARSADLDAIVRLAEALPHFPV